MHRRSRSLTVVALVAGAALIGAAGAIRSCAERHAPTGADAGEASPAAGATASAPAAGPGAIPFPFPPPSPASGWQEAAEAVAIDLRRLLVGRPAAGAYEEARAEGARQDLALFPPEPAELRRLLLSPDPRGRTVALAALAARAEATDDLLRIVLRSQRPEDDEVVRLLGAELVAALPPALVARHEDDLLRAFEREPNPLVLAVALPALERMEEPRLRALLDAQLSLAPPEMLPVLVGIVRDRLGSGALRDLGVFVRAAE